VLRTGPAALGTQWKRKQRNASTTVAHRHNFDHRNCSGGIEPSSAGVLPPRDARPQGPGAADGEVNDVFKAVAKASNCWGYGSGTSTASRPKARCHIPGIPEDKRVFVCARHRARLAREDAAASSALRQLHQKTTNFPTSAIPTTCARYTTWPSKPAARRPVYRDGCRKASRWR
jgi:hypothetical protein